ncbi:MAG: GIY-YIG nuclease family protein [Novosphingobium sp.]|nr:GIY-YIG nuclease family protein [Novosphingobium sp.]
MRWSDGMKLSEYEDWRTYLDYAGVYEIGPWRGDYFTPKYIGEASNLYRRMKDYNTPGNIKDNRQIVSTLENNRHALWFRVIRTQDHLGLEARMQDRHGVRADGVYEWNTRVERRHLNMYVRATSVDADERDPRRFSGCMKLKEYELYAADLRGKAGVYEIGHWRDGFWPKYIGQASDLYKRMQGYMRQNNTTDNRNIIRKLTAERHNLWFRVIVTPDYLGLEARMQERHGVGESGVYTWNSKVERRFLNHYVWR